MKTEILNVRIPKEIIRWLDSLTKIGIYNSRAEAIRDYIRGYIQENKP